MFSQKLTRASTADCSAQIDNIKQVLAGAQAVVVGAGAGLSASAGFAYSGARFRAFFADFEQRYDFHDMYSGGFYPFKTQEERWAYWSRFIACNRYDTEPREVYLQLKSLLEGKNYFVLTTNVDHQFQAAGFEKTRLFYTQGDYGLFQCAEPCRQETWDNEEAIREMVRRQSDMRIPTDLIPICPNCGKQATMNLRSDDRFVEDAGWLAAGRRYQDFLAQNQDSRILFMELGVGYNTPGIIKYTFWRMTARNPQAVYLCINNREAACPSEIAMQSVCINQDIGVLLEQLQHTVS